MINVIIGLGKTGLSCVRYLSKKNANIVVVDNRLNPPELAELRKFFPNVPVHLGSFHEEILSKANEIIISPGVSVKEPAIAEQIKNGKRVIGDIELFSQVAKAPIIAITGSNGKSTVTVLVGEMAKCAGLNVKVGGNLGTPALDLLGNAEPDLYVLELSSFQLETTYSLQAKAAVVLNISPDHMDRYENLAEYKAAKMRIYDGCEVKVIPEQNKFIIQDNYLTYNNKKLLSIDKLKIKGGHQISNCLIALALGKAVNLPMPAMLKALREFTGLPHRCQWVAKINNIDYYNDSKGTNVAATKAAIEGLGAMGKIVLIAGGQGKGADFLLLFSAVKKYVRALILIGEDADKLKTALTGASKILFAQSMQEAVKSAAQEAQPGDMVLLSPACASFDMFDNFEHRGDVFMEIVKNA
jgi:UDP-N-acetylmuramoylalanine--D-glutamate ligase